MVTAVSHMLQQLQQTIECTVSKLQVSYLSMKSQKHFKNNFKMFMSTFLNILQVREQVMQRYRIATHQKTYADMIREDAVPDIGYVLYFHLLPVTLSVVSA